MNQQECGQMRVTEGIGDRVEDIAEVTISQSEDAEQSTCCDHEMINEEQDLQPETAEVSDLNYISMDNAIDELLKDTASSSSEPEAPELMDWSESLQSNGVFGGVHNLGNTCYMASALQMLASLDGFVDTLENDKFESQTVNENGGRLRREFLKLMRLLREGKTVKPHDFKAAIDSRSSLFLGFRQQDAHEFLTTLLDLLDEDYKGRPKNASKQLIERRERSRGEFLSGGSALGTQLRELDVSPTSSKRPRTGDSKAFFTDQMPFSLSKLGVEDIGKLLHETHSCVEMQLSPLVAFPGLVTASELRCKLIGGQMNTAEMILTRYTEENDPLNEQKPTLAASETDNSSMETSNEGPSQPESPLAEYFTTEVRIRLTCDSCKFSRTHKEKFWHLSLEIGPDSGSVDEGLRRFFAPEKREIKCEKCFCSSATQTSEIIRLPRALLLHFKRFIVDVSEDYSSVTYRKNRSPVLFDEELSLHDHLSVLTEFTATDYVKPDLAVDGYSIRSVVNHIGSSASCGHYTADSHRWYDKDRRWTRFNDSYVSSISSIEALENSRETAYMVMYEIPSIR
jgi:ubiquitin C-terminal hydrolase